MNNYNIKNQGSPCFTREQTESLKRVIGMDEFYPTIWDVNQAEKIFITEIEKYKQCVESEIMSVKSAVYSAVAQVWAAGRRYESQRNKAMSTVMQE